MPSKVTVWVLQGRVLVLVSHGDGLAVSKAFKDLTTEKKGTQKTKKSVKE